MLLGIFRTKIDITNFQCGSKFFNPDGVIKLGKYLIVGIASWDMDSSLTILYNVSNEFGFWLSSFETTRRGIGWHLLKASEELISKMTSSSEVYLHCRMIDTAPFNMYTKAGYYIVKTDSILILLMLQRRKHLMCKKLPVATSPLESDILGSDGGLTWLERELF